VRIPASLAWWGESAEGAAWLARLPRLAQECAALWDLELGEAYADAYASLVLRVHRADGSSAVLKLAFPDAETAHQVAALRHWGPDVVAAVLDEDPGRHAVLLEAITPGTRLPPAELETVIPRVLDALHATPPPAGGPFRELADDAARWHRDIPVAWEAGGRPFGPDLLRAVLLAIEELATTQPERVLCHQDLHCGNVLRSARAPAGHLVIDPLPIAGERAFDLLGVGLNHPSPMLLDTLARAIGVDPQRACGWALVHALAWGYGGPATAPRWLPRHIAVARLLSLRPPRLSARR
jgi:streptomycin 6-kinase